MPFPPWPSIPKFLLGNQGALRTIHAQGYASRPGSPGIRITEGHLTLTEKRLCEQRRNLLWLPHKGEADRWLMPQEGQRTRSSRWRDDHPGSPGKPDTGRRGLDIPGSSNEARVAIGYRERSSK